jgi:hypothetical protein
MESDERKPLLRAQGCNGSGLELPVWEYDHSWRLR